MGTCFLCKRSFLQRQPIEIICNECLGDLTGHFDMIHPNETDEEFWDHEKLVNDD